MAATSATAPRVVTDLTCWKCGDETLRPVSGDSESTASDGRTALFGNQHSVCSKCGALSVNAAQAKHNKTVNRKSRRASIRESNRRLA